MTSEVSCASCASTENPKHCVRCKTVSYCSKDCQRAHWQTHKQSCHFQVATSSPATSSTVDALSLLRARCDPGTAAQPSTPKTSAVIQLFNITELRLAVFIQLSASELLRSQRVCRSWYLTIASEANLQQRLFFSPGPGELVLPAVTGWNTHPGVHPRNASQRQAFDMEKRMSGSEPYLITASDGVAKELSATALEQTGAQIILNPFFTSLWPQDPSNMSSSPYIAVSNGPESQAASWRRMYLTSPPITSVGMSLWCTKRTGKSNQLIPTTGHVPSGVTLGHVADMLAAQPKKLTYHWMQLHGYNWWLRARDAVVVPNEGDVGNIEARPGVYVNPSNGLPMPGF